MNLKCKINGKYYNIAQGATFAEEYNETLDSGTIIIPQIEKIINLMPFDDVFIFDSESEFNGYGPNVEMPKFYKHLLVDQFTEEIINLEEGIYNYKIELMSETKKLEVIQLPNISITQPLNKDKKKSIYKYLKDFVDLYSPLKKVVNNTDKKTWSFEKKYKIDENLITDFDNVYAPDFSLNSPSLKDVISQLMLVKDRIPYVKDDVIYALDISLRKGPFDLNKKHINYVSGSRSSANHTDNLKRTYSNALSQDNTCNMVEYMGFRNSDSALLTLENMRLETRYPIYKINKIYMCYYKKVKVVKTNENFYDDETKNNVFLCKQDITKLVKLNSERNLLSQDWDEFEKLKGVSSIDELSKFKMLTVGYNIGSNFIEGWGTKYTYPTNIPNIATNFKLWDVQTSYIQNIFGLMNELYPLGIYDSSFSDKFLNLEENESVIQTPKNSVVDIVKNDVINPNVEIGNWNDIDVINGPAFMKTLFFIVDYNAFYNGTIVYSKDDRFRDDITINDNASASLTLLEKDGLFQKEKINRFGNKGISINARYDDFSQLQELGSVYENEDDTDVVIYHREYSIWDNVINCSYAGTKNYVLKNYFTSVFARYRTYNLMSYSESVSRAENNKMLILLSKNKLYYEQENNKFEFEAFENDDYIKQIFSFIIPTEKTNVKNLLENRGEINTGIISYGNNWYLTDVNKFVAGNSLCFNLKMFDNVSGGVYIKNLQPDYNFNYEDDFVGSVQDWYITVDDNETGKAEFLGFYILNLNDKNQYSNQLIPLTENNYEYIQSILTQRIMKLPYLANYHSINYAIKNKIGGNYKINKDNKETIDMTFQFEPICYENDVIFSPWMMKLSDLLLTYNKYDEEGEKIEKINEDFSLEIISTALEINNLYLNKVPMIIFSVNKDELETFKKIKGYYLNDYVRFTQSGQDWDFVGGEVGYYNLKFKEIREANENYLTILAEETDGISDKKSSANFSYLEKNKELIFKRIETNEFLKVPDDKIYFSNIEIIGTKFSETKNVFEFKWTDNKNSLLISNPYIYYLLNGKTYSFNETVHNPILNEENAKFKNVIPKITDDSLDYNKNMFIVYNNENIKKDIIYEEYELSDMNVSNDKISEKFSIKKDNYNRDYLHIDLQSLPYDTKSVQYWYLNNGSLHFVFGANVTESDLKNGYIKIYLSLLSTKDTRVYDQNNNLIGEIYNYADVNNTKKYGEAQYYYDIIENDSKGE